MTKVKTTQIPEDSPTYFPDRKKSKQKIKGQIEFDEDFDDEEPEDKTKNMICRVMVEFGRVILNIYQVSTISKIEEFFETPEAHWEYGIIINEGYAPSVQNPKTDIKQFWENEKGRDEAYDNLKKALEDAGVVILKI